jgi:hypothetical protein
MGMSEAYEPLQRWVIVEVGNLTEAELKSLVVLLADGTIARLGAERTAIESAKAKGGSRKRMDRRRPVQGDNVTPFPTH